MNKISHCTLIMKQIVLNADGVLCLKDQLNPVLLYQHTKHAKSHLKHHDNPGVQGADIRSYFQSSTA